MSRLDHAREAAGLPARPVPWAARAAAALLTIAVIWSYRELEFKWSRLADAPADIWAMVRAMVTDIDFAETGTR